MGVLILIITLLLCSSGKFCNAVNNDKRVNVGVLLDYDSWVGKVAKTAMEIAADDVNTDTQLLNGSQLVLHFRDSGGDAVVGASAGNLIFCFFLLGFINKT